MSAATGDVGRRGSVRGRRSRCGRAGARRWAGSGRAFRKQRRHGRARRDPRDLRASWRCSRRCSSRSDDLDVTKATGGILAAAVRELPARHRRDRPLGARARRLGHPGLAARRPRGHGDLDGHRHAGRHRVGSLQRLGRRRCSSGSPTGSWSSRSCRWPSCWPPCSARSLLNIIIVIGDHLLARHGAARPGPDPVRRGAALPRTGPGARRRPLAPDDAARPAQRHAAGARQHDADRGHRDPVRDDAVLPRASATPSASRGARCSRTRSRRGRSPPAPGGTSSRPASASWWSSCWRSPWSGGRSRTSSTRGWRALT